MNWYICTTCGRYCYFAASPDSLINGRCPQPDCNGYTVPDPEAAGSHMTNALLAEIRARCEAATPGPWYWDAIDAHKCICLESKRWKVMDFVRYGMNGAAPRFLVNGIMERADTLLKSIPGKEHHRGFDNYIDHHDADFIAHAREDIPYLLSEVDRLTARAEKAEAALKEAKL